VTTHEDGLEQPESLGFKDLPGSECEPGIWAVSHITRVSAGSDPELRYRIEGLAIR
jgi:hypothetical protein